MSTVSKETTHLKLHRPVSENIRKSNPKGGQSVSDFWSVFAATTGWRIDAAARRRGGPVALAPNVSAASLDHPAVLSDIDDLDDSASDAIQRIDEAGATSAAPHASACASLGGATSGHSLMPGMTKSAAESLAAAAVEMSIELRQTRQQLRRESAAMAAGALLSSPESTEAIEQLDQLADDLQQHLADAVAATGTTAAVLYMLDDESELLTPVSTFGVPESALATEPRPLRGARGDLEALVSHVVTADAFVQGGLDTFRPPTLDGVGPMGGGICVAIHDDGCPIGTMWLLSKDACRYGLEASAAARLAASAVRCTLTRYQNAHSAAANEANDEAPIRLAGSATHDVVADVSRFQYLSLPSGTRLASDWAIDGMLESPRDWATGWHDWDILPDGTFMLAMADSDDESITGALSATIAQAALASHTLYKHDVCDLLRRISDSMWRWSTSHEPISMLFAHVDPETGSGRMAAAGSIQAMIGSRYGYRPLYGGDFPPIGYSPDVQFQPIEFRIQTGESFLSIDRGFQLDGIHQWQVGQKLHQSIRSGQRYPLASVRSDFESTQLKHQRGAVILSRYEKDRQPANGQSANRPQKAQRSRRRAGKRRPR
ncbi:MAG: SpoIIE family protein phosphatase [Planctomycetota bacterium]